MNLKSQSNKTIAILISGNGSNLQAIIDAIQQQQLAVTVVVVISDQADAFGLLRAQSAGIPTVTLLKQDYPTRVLYDQALGRVLQQYTLDLVVLSGFMRILGKELVRLYRGKIINIHPSLLPKYKGLHTYQRVLATGDTEHGATVHFVTEMLDGGPIIAQWRVPIVAGDTPETLCARVQQLEHRLYPRVIQILCQDNIRLIDNEVQFVGDVCEQLRQPDAAI